MPTQKKPKKKAKQNYQRVRFQADLPTPATQHNVPTPATQDKVTREEFWDFTPPRDLSQPVLRREVQAKAEPVTSKYVIAK
eukprot:81205-Amphidinium_carterae.1